MANLPAKKDEIVPKGTAPINRLLAGELELPKDVTDVIDVRGWAQSLITKVEYKEPDPDYLQRMLLLQTLSAETLEDVLSQAGIRSLQKSIPDTPGGTTGPIEIYGLYVTDSDFGEGAKTYLILSTRDLETGMEVRYTTGAQQVQAQVLAAICLGVWPLKCRITRTERKDKGGKFMFWVGPPDGD